MPRIGKPFVVSLSVTISLATLPISTLMKSLMMSGKKWKANIWVIRIILLKKLTELHWLVDLLSNGRLLCRALKKWIGRIESSSHWKRANRMSQMISQLEKNIASYKEEYAQLIAIKNDLKHDMFKTKLIAVCLNLIYNLPSR